MMTFGKARTLGFYLAVVLLLPGCSASLQPGEGAEGSKKLDPRKGNKESEIQWISSTEVARAGYHPRADSVGSPAPTDSMGHAGYPAYVPPKPYKLAEPNFPVAAVLSGLQGTVWVKALVDENGYVATARVVKSSGYDYAIGFEREALISAMKNRFKPATQDGRPLTVWIAYPIHFKIHGQ